MGVGECVCVSAFVYTLNDDVMAVKCCACLNLIYFVVLAKISPLIYEWETCLQMLDSTYQNGSKYTHNAE